MEIKPQETIKSYCNNHLHVVYWHQLPKWVQFVVFLDRGLFNGFSTFKLSRVWCWFGKHKWSTHKYEEWKDGVKTKLYTHLCRRCCMTSKKYELE